MKTRSLTLFVVLLIFSLANAQSSDYKTKFGDAEYHFMNEEYEAALKLYLELLKESPDNANLNYRIGTCYLYLPYENIRSIDYLKKSITNISTNYKEGSYKEEYSPIGSLFFLGYAYHLCNFFEEASIYYSRYRDTLPLNDKYNMEMVERQILSVDNAKEIIKSPVNIEIQNIGHVINSGEDDFNPAVSADGNLLIYTHNRPLEKRDTISIYYNNLYHEIKVSRKIGEELWTEPVDITKELNSKGTCVTLSLSADGKTLLLYKDDWLDGGITDNKAGAIYISHFNEEKEKWEPMQIVHNEINTTNWETHACISPDGKSIYFASDRKGGFGGLDLYVTQQDENGNWSKAQNLGPTINTPYDENTPYILEDSVTLYFSSEGHFNMGGFDVFKSIMQPNGEWSNPENLGYPINSTGDDLFFVPIKDGSTAFYSVDRHEGYFTFGGKDIYQLDIVGENDNNDTLVAQIDSTLVSDSLAIANNNAADKNSDFQMPTFKERDVYTIRNIYFDFNSSALSAEALKNAEQIFKLMNENPSLYIEIIGHTDSKGSDDYNNKLSLERSQKVADYLIKKGINPKRFVTTGLGKKDLLAKESYSGNSKTNGEKYNRRVEIKILKPNNEVIIKVDDQIPENLRIKAYNQYYVVVAESKTAIQIQNFENINETIITMQTPEGYIYYFGNYTNKADAQKKLNSIVAQGHTQAYMSDYFELHKKSKYSSENKLGMITKYTIQLKPLDNKKLDNTKTKGIDEKQVNGLYRYTYKEFTDLKTAQEVLKEVWKLGFKEAFIVETYSFE